ncbi:protein mono-ADP-ribosyltransferase PARP10 [Erinaceus europaeus]|uniref:Poly [ADP-ribose] polymerase n=1 Tax=Erinaceus europaeus TaxID=9365 RepID=A0A1S3W2M5_ERIEU|nr:protein mono-ADP-ribosyltransferase PARP10 [Erinaceus europaeus]
MQEATAKAGAAVELSGLPPDVSDEFLTLYFENHRRSAGGPVLSWQRLGHGGVLTFREPAVAARVLAQEEHTLQGARLSLRPSPPLATDRLLLQGLPPGTAPPNLERHVQLLLRAAGLPEMPCQALDSPRPDRALVQLQQPLSQAEVCALKEQAGVLSLKEGVPVSLAQIPQTRAVRVLGGSAAVEPLLLELYMENERRSGGGALEGWHSLPGHLGTVVSFQQWQVAERVLQREHCLQGVELSLVPHYDVLEPEELAKLTSEGDHLVEPESRVTDHMPPGKPIDDSRTETVNSSVSVGQCDGPTVSLGQAVSTQTPKQVRPLSPGPMGSPGPVGSVEASLEPPGQEGLVERMLCMEPGAMRFMQLFHGDFLASLSDVAVFPIGGPETTGFRLYGAPTPCQAAEEFLQSLLGSISCHVLRLQHPGSARFLLGPEGQRLLEKLESQFQCVFGTERLARLALDTEAIKVDPMEVLPEHPASMDKKQQTMNLEEVQELLASLEGLEREDWQPLEPREEDLEGQPEEEDSAGSLESLAPGTRVFGQLEEEAALQLALHRSLEPSVWAAEQEEAAALQQALARSLLEPSLMEMDQAEGASAAEAQLLVHMAFEQDVEELDRVLGAALGEHLLEETVELRGCLLPSELCTRLQQCHGVSLALQGDSAVLRGFGAQPARAARHLATLLAAPQGQDWVSSLVPVPMGEPAAQDGGGGAQWNSGLAQRLKDPAGKLECLAESSSEFQEVVRAFCHTLDAAYSRIRVVKVERVWHPLLQHQYELHREQLEQRCERRPVERVLYHGTSRPAVQDICLHGFNRSFCGRNGTLYGQGVYFALRASLSVQDRYSPPDAHGHKAVFVARVLTGDYAQGHRGLRAPPVRASGDSPLRYDSAVDCLRQPSIFIIFHDTQALPTHLITCERLASPTEANAS